MAVTEYIGPIVAPHMEGEWSSANSYESLAMVTYEGNTYTAKQDVPVGVQITNETYWFQSGNYNAQIENYRREVQQFDGRITTNASNISAETTRAEAAEKANADAISAETSARESAINSFKVATTYNELKNHGFIYKEN